VSAGHIKSAESADKRTRLYERDATHEEIHAYEQNQALEDAATAKEPPNE